MRRDCCASTRSRKSFLGFAIACSMAVLVISWNTMRSTFFASMPSAAQRCQPMASPSRSSSVAIHIFSASLASFLSSVTRFFLSGVISYSGINPHPISIPIRFSGRSRMCPNDASTRKSFPRNFSIVFHLAGDSTITRFLDI